MAGYDRRTGARADHPAHYDELDAGFVRAVFKFHVAGKTTKVTLDAGRFDPTHATRASVGSFGRESLRSHILTVGEPSRGLCPDTTGATGAPAHSRRRRVISTAPRVQFARSQIWA
jgi:hypothetical protein